MIFIKVNRSDDPTKAHIMSKLYVPFDSVNGLKKLDGTVYTIDEKDEMEKEQDGYLVDYDQYSEPKPNPPEGQISNGEFFNTQTREYLFDYIDKPIDNTINTDDIKEMLKNILKDSIQ